MSHYKTSRIFAATFSAETITTNEHDLFSIIASSNSRVRVHRIDLGQQSTAPSNLRQLHVELLRGSTTPISSGSTEEITPANLSGWETAPAAASRAQGPTTSLASSASHERIHADAFDEAGWSYCPNECAIPVLDNGQRLDVRVSAPTTGMSLSGTLIFEEIGQIP